MASTFLGRFYADITAAFDQNAGGLLGNAKDRNLQNLIFLQIGLNISWGGRRPRLLCKMKKSKSSAGAIPRCTRSAEKKRVFRNVVDSDVSFERPRM